MRIRLLPFAALLAACGGSPSTSPSPTTGLVPFATAAQWMAEHRVDAIASRKIGHAAYWEAMAPATRSHRLRVTTVGRSGLGRELKAVTFGRGPIKVLLWSQMHGDESTATMALADLIHWLGDDRDDPVRQRLLSRLTVTMVPMLNPDGAERWQRENAQGIDVNRDVRRLATPEGRLLKALRDSIRPDYGFNLHDQGGRTRAGVRGPQAAIALLAPAADASNGYGAVRQRARRLAAILATALADSLPGRVAKYDEGFNARAFGDQMQAWGTSTVLIESGAIPGDPDKQRLRHLNAAALLVALDAIASHAPERASHAAYDALPLNAAGASDVLIRGGSIVLPGRAPYVADLAINYDDPVARTGPRLREVGDLAAVVAIDTVDATGLFVHPAPEMLRTGPDGQSLPLGAAARLDLRRGREPSSALVRSLFR